MIRFPPLAVLVRAGAVTCWLATVAAGLALLSVYAGAPGAPATPPEHWPVASTIVRRAGLPTVLVFAHPSCPCTRATLGELDRMLARVDGHADVHVLVLQPERDRAWPDTDLARLAAAIPTVQVEWDAAGTEATRFGVATSGQVLVYAANDDRLQFAGGITGARGHAGDNPGLDGVLLQLTAQSGPTTSSPVFGCELWSPPTT
jgi:hypothetical protein